MKPHPPQQLSFDFEGADEPQVPETTSLDRSGLASAPSVPMTLVQHRQDATVVSLCELRVVREQRRMSDIYQSIRDSISHIA